MPSPLNPPTSALAPALISAFESGVTVLTPRRNAHWLQQAYAKHALSQGLQVWPTPKAQAFEALVLQVWRILTHDTRRILDQNQSRLLWERVVERSPLAESLLSRQAAANSSFLAWQRCIAWQLTDGGKLDQTLQPYVDTGNAEAQALLEWSHEFLAICNRRNWLPVSLLPLQLMQATYEDLRAAIVDPLATLATHELTPLEKSLLQRFVDCGVQVTTLDDAHIDGTSDTEQQTLAACDSDEHELQCAALWARKQLVLGNQSIGIVTELSSRMQQVQRVMQETLSPGTAALAMDANANKPIEIFSLAGYRRLNEFPLVAAALDVLRLVVGHADSNLVGMVLRSPFITGVHQAGAHQESSLRALADARLRSRTREHYDLASVERLCHDAGCVLLAARLRELQVLHGQLPARALPSVWVEHIIALWKASGWPDTSLDSDEQQTLARLQSSVGEFGALDELLGPLNFVAAIHQFQQWIAGVRFEPRRLPTPITVVDNQSLQGLRFDAVWITGMSETRWPPAATPDAFIPFELQQKARMPFATAKAVHRQSQQHLQLLRGLAPTVVVSYARYDQDTAVAASTWVRDLPPQSLLSSTSYGETIFAARPTLEVLQELAAPTTSGQVRGGARLFELQSQCPFRAFAEIRLRATPLDQVMPSIDVTERGMLIHAVLAQVWDQLRDSKQLQQLNDDQLSEQVRAALVFHSAKLLEGASPHRIRLLQIEQQLALTRILKALNLDKQRAPFRVVGRPEASMKFAVDKIGVELRLDRVDELIDASNASNACDSSQQNARVIVDYKSGANVSTRTWWHDRPELPQLPLYATALPARLAAVAFATVSAKSVAYQGVACADGILPGVPAFDGRQLPGAESNTNNNESNWQQLLNHWRSVIERLAKQFADGDVSIDPLPNACRYCHLATLCRVNESDVMLESDESFELGGAI